MAVLTQQAPVQRAFQITGLAPKGTWLATCIDNKDQLGVTRPVYGDPTKSEQVDLTTFLFELVDENGKKHLIASKAMRISSNIKSSLTIFLQSWLGHAIPPNFDTRSVIGRRAFISIDHRPGTKHPESMFGSIANISPVPHGYGEPQGSQKGGVQTPQPEAQSQKEAIPQDQEVTA